MENRPDQATRPIARGWIAFLTILFTIVLIPSILAVSLNQTLFSENFYKNILVKINIYDQNPTVFTEIIGQSLAFGETGNNGVNPFSIMSTDQMDELIQSLLPQNYVQDQAGQLLDSLFSFVNLKTTQFTLKIDLTQVKNNFQGQTGIDAINRLIDSLPACTQQQIDSFIQSIPQLTTGDFSSLQLCKPPQLYLSIFTPLFTSIAQQSASAIPSEITIFDSNKATFSQVIISPAFRIYVIFRKTMMVLPWIILLLAILILIFGLRSAKTLLLSLGIPLLVSGAICALIYLAVKFLEQTFLLKSINLGSGSALNSLVISGVQTIFGQFVIFGLFLSGAIFVVGLIIFAVASQIKT